MHAPPVYPTPTRKKKEIVIMPASTRSASGITKPRALDNLLSAPTTTKKTKTKTSVKANTSKPRTNKVASGRVEKKSAPATKKTVKAKKPTTRVIKDKVAGNAKKAAGKVERKPAKEAAGTKKAKSTTTKKVAAPKTKKT